MKITSVENLVHTYLDLRGRHEHAPASGFLGPRTVCSWCMRGPATKEGKKGREREVCASCHRAWKPMLLTSAVRPSRSLRMRKQSTKRAPPRDRTGSFIARLDDWAWVRPIFENRPYDYTLPDWEAHQLVLIAYHDDRWGTYRSVAELGEKLMPGAPRGWSLDIVRGMLERASIVIERRVRRRSRWAGLTSRAVAHG